MFQLYLKGAYMKSHDIDALSRAVPGLRDERRMVDWPDTLLVLEDHDAELIDAELFEPASDDEDRWPDNIKDNNELRRIEREIESAELIGVTVPKELAEVHSAVRDAVGTGFPGAPHGDFDGPYGPSGPILRPAPTELYAFYLPWHFFPNNIWGIYLLVEGIEALGRDILGASGGWLTRKQSNHVARLFLFHHEAYHNISETFAARLEVSHRQPCYLGGFRQVWQSSFANGLHEEGLADAYAYHKVAKECFADFMPTGPQRKWKRRVAGAALRNIIRQSAPPYSSAQHMLTPRRFASAQSEFQEANHGACMLGPSASADIWAASGHSMHPSLQRNKGFSYVISRAHPAIRLAANVPQYNRADVVRRVKLATGGKEVAGGKHPMIQVPGGRRVPLPSDRQVNRHTVDGFLRKLGVPVRLDEFMRMSDRELKSMQLEEGD